MDAEILIIGAGAAGLIAARKLAKAGKKVIILEARNRIGGRIFPLSDSDFGYPAQGGAEFVHGSAPVTKALLKEAGLTFVPEEGEIWSSRKGELSLHKQFIQSNDLLKEKLEALKEDVSIADFLQKNFNGKEHESFRNSIIKVVEGYDAADPKEISTFTLRDEWLGKDDWNDGKIKEGYGALLDFLEKECLQYGVQIKLDSCVQSVNLQEAFVSVSTKQKVYRAQKVIVTVPLPVLKDIEFSPEFKEKLQLVSKIGFGNVVKILIKFKTRWWENVLGKDLSKMAFLLCDEKFLTWWTQYPEINTVLTGWMGGPEAANYKNSSPEELLDISLVSLSNIFKIDKKDLAKAVVTSKVLNWPADPFTKGAYSYTKVDTKDAYENLAKPIDDTIFFAGEAYYSGDATATVEGALGSGLEAAREILVKAES